MSYSAEISRKSSGMNLVLPTMAETLERIAEYNASFPDEIIEIKIAKIPSRTEARSETADARKKAHDALSARVIELFDKGYSESAISKNMGIARSTVRILLRTPVNSEEWFEKGDTKKQIAQVSYLIDKGMSIPQIAKKMNISEGFVRGVIIASEKSKDKG